MDKEGDFLQNQPAASGNSARFRGIMDFVLIIRDRWIWGLAIALPVTLLFAYKELKEDKLFVASSAFQLELPKKILDLTPVEQDGFSKPVLGRHAQRLKSKEFRERLLASLSGDDKEAMLKPYRELNATKGIQIPTVASLIRYDVAMGGTHIPTITINSSSFHNGQGASIVANKVQSEYLKHVKASRSDTEAIVIAKLNEQLDQMSTEEKNIEEELETFRNEHSLVSVEITREFIVAAMQDMKSKINSEKVGKLNNEAVLLQIMRQQGMNQARGLDENQNLHLIDEVAAYGNIRDYRNAISELERTRKKLEDRYLERHPKILANLAETDEYKRLLNGEIDLAESTFQQNVLTANQRIKHYNQELEQELRKSQQLDKINIDYRVIERAGEAKTALRQRILKRINDIEVLQEIEHESSLTAGAQAGTPMAPVSPNRNQVVTKSIGVFFIAFLFVPIGLEFLDNRVKSPWDIEVFIGREMLAGIPRISLVSETNRPLIVAQDLDESLVESFRGLYSRIQMNSDNIYPKSILVTSAIPSEGKSLLAANLAHSFANHGRKTLLIDFDLRRPGLHKFCGLSNDRGLLTFLQEPQANPSAPLNMDDIPEVYPNLRLLPSGGKTRTATELLEKLAFTNLLIKLKREFDVLLLDSSPVGLFPDSSALATKVDELIFVTRYSKVGRRTAKSMLDKLAETGVRILGVVLNDLPENKSSSYYYNYGYYGYGYGYYRYKYYSKYYGDDDPDTMAKRKKTRTS